MQNLIQIDRQSLLTAWTWAMAHTLWIGLVLAFIFYAFLHHFSSTNSKIKYRIGLGLLALLPVSSFIAFLSYLPSSENSTSVITYFSTNTAAFSTPEQLTFKPAFSSYIYKYSDSLFLIWVIGIVILSIRMLWSYVQVQKLKANAVDIEHGHLKSLFDSIYKKSMLKKSVRLVSSQRIDIPSTVGHIKPIIVLPISIINQLTIEETYAVIAHEIAHIMRTDYLFNLMISCIEVVYFFHPSVWWFSATLRSLREQCCDDIAIQLGAEKMALSKALVQLEEQTHTPLLAMAFSHKHQLLNRIQRLFNPTMKNEFNIGRSQAPILLGSLALLLAFSKPIANTVQANTVPLLHAFLWEEKPVADTTKPKSKIEKITKDNGKEKLELKLKDKKIDELKVNDKVIPPSEYSKYAEKTEELQKELKEIDSPEGRARVKVYSDMDADLLDNEDHYIISTPGDRDRVILAPKSKTKDGAKARVYVSPGHGSAAPFVYHGNGGNYAYIYGGGKSGSRSWAGSARNGDDIKWTIEGDSSNITIDGDRIIIKNEKGDVIVDMDGDHRSWNLIRPGKLWFPGDAFENRELFNHFPDDLKWKLEKELKMKQGDLLKLNGELQEQVQRELHDRLRDGQKMHKELWEEKSKGLQKLFNEKGVYRLGDAWGDAWDDDRMHWSNGKNNLNQAIQNKIIKDGIVKEGETYDFKIDDNSLKINGKKQNETSYNEFKSLIKDYTGIEMKNNSFFSFNGIAKSDK